MTLEVWGNRFGLSGTTTSGPAVTTYAQLPVATSVPGQLRQLSDVNNIVVQSLGGLWRPYGGRQVLAQRVLNPVTTQNRNAPGAVAETMGPFPGGLLRAGMRLILDAWIRADGIGTGARIAFWEIGENNAFPVSQINLSDSGTDKNSQLIGQLDVLTDVGGPHRSLRKIVGSYPTGAASYTNLPFNFSAPWSTNIRMQSATENSVNITGASWSAGVATYTTSAAHTLAVGDKDVIAGITPSGYNTGSNGAIVTAVGSSTQFSIAMPVDPGTYTSGGNSSRISNMIVMGYKLFFEG